MLSGVFELTMVDLGVAEYPDEGTPWTTQTERATCFSTP